MESLNLFVVPGLPLVQPGDDVAGIIVEALHRAGEEFVADDIVVIAQKIVSKAEGRLVRLDDVEPDAQAREIAQIVDKDERAVQVILDDSREIIRARRGLLVVEQNGGWICANAGVDRSNVEPRDSTGEMLSLLPVDADASAQRLRTRMAELTGVAPAVIINDSHGRPWRTGTVGVTIGCAGLAPLWNQRGQLDLYGHELRASEECVADELAAAASLLMGQANEGRPVVVVRGYRLPDGIEAAPAREIQRPAHMDVFR